MSRRTFIAGLLAATAIAILPRYVLSGDAPEAYPVTMTDDEWRAKLNPDAYKVLRKHGTEPAGSSPLNLEKRKGVFHCAGCDRPLYSSDQKYDSGTGWPSFWAPINDEAVGYSVDNKLFYSRDEVHCANCGGHLGHVFNDGPPPTGKRYCMNGVAMTFKPRES